MASHVHQGKRIDYTPAAAKTAGDVVVQEDLVGVVDVDIAANRKGALAIEGVYEFPKNTGAGTDYAAGRRLYWDATNVKATHDSNGGANKPLGKVVLAVATTDTLVWVKLHDAAVPADLIYSAEAASAVITNTDAETDFDKKVTVPANTLRAGDVIRVRAMAKCPSTNSTNTLTLKLKLGSIVIIATAAVDVADDDLGYLEADIVFRTVGATGTLVAAGMQCLDAAGTNPGTAIKDSTVVDTTVANDVKVSATWSAAHADNQVRLDVMDVELLRK